MREVNVLFNYHDIDTTLDRLRDNPDTDALYIYVGDAEGCGDTLAISVREAELLLVGVRSRLGEIYAKEARP